MRFSDRELGSFWSDPCSYHGKRIPADVQKALFRKLQILDAAYRLDDLRIPPGNRLEALKGARAGQYSIRVNDRWRLCFVWEDGEPREVEFCDYHK